MKGDAPCSNIVISSRIRLARNVHSRWFPGQTQTEDSVCLLQEVFDLVEGNPAFDGYERTALRDLSDLERQSLVERYLTSREHIEIPEGRGLCCNRTGSISVMINEEDHFRIQALCSGLQLGEALHLANEVDDVLDSRFGFAFSPQHGYLTACPTNLGTGIRASVLLHLSALVLLGRIEKVVESARQVGLAVRGVYGEGSNADGSLYQVSNQVTLGRSEQQILTEVGTLAQEIVKHEQSARNELLRLHRLMLEDHVWRAYALLSSARSMATTEATDRLSALRLGFDLGMFRGITEERFNELLVWIRPACLQTLNGREMDTRERDASRATLLRNAVSTVTGARL